jgi:hypothetical protein
VKDSLRRQDYNVVFVQHERLSIMPVLAGYGSSIVRVSGKKYVIGDSFVALCYQGVKCMNLHEAS